VSFSRIWGKLIYRRSTCDCKVFHMTLPLMTVSLSLGQVFVVARTNWTPGSQ
jgi:hypothetical protein